MCTRQEFSEIKKLEVESAIYYFDQDCVENLEEYISKKRKF